jgi:hypothetical protein
MFRRLHHPEKACENPSRFRAASQDRFRTATGMDRGLWRTDAGWLGQDHHRARRKVCATAVAGAPAARRGGANDATKGIAISTTATPSDAAAARSLRHLLAPDGAWRVALIMDC